MGSGVVTLMLAAPVLSGIEMERLTFWKWRYMLEGLGFADCEVDSLMFLAWRYATGQIEP